MLGNPSVDLPACSVLFLLWDRVFRSNLMLIELLLIDHLRQNLQLCENLYIVFRTPVL